MRALTGGPGTRSGLALNGDGGLRRESDADRGLPPPRRGSLDLRVMGVIVSSTLTSDSLPAGYLRGCHALPFLGNFVGNFVGKLARWLPERELHLCADGAYATLADANLINITLTSRMRRDAALYEPAPARTGKRGRPRTKGARLPTPTQIAANLDDQHWQQEIINMRGTPAQRLVYTRDVLWYRVNKTELVRLVIIRDPDGVEPDDFFFTTDLTATGAQTPVPLRRSLANRGVLPRRQTTPRRPRPINHGNATAPNAPHAYRCGSTQ